MQWLCPPLFEFLALATVTSTPPFRKSLTHLFTSLPIQTRVHATHSPCRFVAGTQEHQGQALVSHSSWSSSEGQISPDEINWLVTPGLV